MTVEELQKRVGGDYQIIEIWGKVESTKNDVPWITLYHCSTAKGNFDFWTDAEGNLMKVTPSVIEPE